MRAIGGWNVAATLALVALIGASSAAARAGLAVRNVAPFAAPADARTAPAPSAVSAPLSGAGAPKPTQGELLRRLSRATSRNPFRPDRSRAPGRYGVAAPSRGPEYDAPAPHPPMPAQPPLRLLGVAALGGGAGIATLGLHGHPPRLVRVGEQIEGHRLLSVAPGEARLQGPDSITVLRLDRTGPPIQHP